MLCTSCGDDRSPIIEGDQAGHFNYTCGNPGCHANLGPVVREHTAPKILPGPPTDAPPLALVPPPASPGIADVGGSYVDTIRARIAVLDRELAKADALRAERTMLARMLKAAERKDKSRPSNVVPIARGAS
jgi:hypothetical protein